MELNSHPHCVFKITYHLVFVTKFRRKALSQPILDRLKEIYTNLCTKWGCELLEFGGEADHVHLLIDAHPNIHMSKFVNNLKTVSSRYIRKEYSGHLAKFYWIPVLWSGSYCLLSTGGAPIDVLKKYIENQGQDKK